MLTNLRRQRGYNWERKIVKKFSQLGFVSVRLGGTTTSMPDVSAHKDQSKLIISIECKSGVSSSLIIPTDQLERCMKWCELWGLYENKIVILAFKFARKDVKGNSRIGKEYLKIWNWKLEPVDVWCNYDGTCSIKGREIFLEEFKI